MSQEHTHHSHAHASTPLKSLNNAFIIGIALNLAYVVVQIIVGLNIHSLSLLSDAGHNFLDVGGLALSLLAFKLTKSKATEKYTYGLKKSSILISLFNGVILLLSIGAIGYEAISSFNTPQHIPGNTIAIVAAIGIIINGISAYLFFKNSDSKDDINVKTAFWHLLSDAIVSLALVVGGILIYFTHLYWIDRALSIAVCLVIIVSTWNLFKSSIRLSLDGVPESIKMEEIRSAALNIKGVIAFKHIHVWAMSTTDNALTGHLVVNKNLTTAQINEIKTQLKHQLMHLGIGHSTIEIETDYQQGDDDENCSTPNTFTS